MFDFSQLPQPLHEYTNVVIVPINGNCWRVVLECRLYDNILLGACSVVTADRQDRALVLRDELVKTLRAARALVGKV